MMKKKYKKRVKINIGDRFNRFFILEFVGNIKNNGNSHYKVCCDCGKEKIVQSNKLVSGHTKSCGCLHKEIIRKPPGHISFIHKFNQYRIGAKKRKMKFLLSFHQFCTIIKQNCYYCNHFPKKFNVYLNNNGIINTKQSISLDGIDRSWIEVNGIDRLNSKLDYVIENCVSCCASCNEMKMDSNVQDFLDKVEQIYKHVLKQQKE